MKISTAWKVSKYGVFSGPYFPVFGLNTEIYFVFLRIQCEYRKIRTRKNYVFKHFSRSVGASFFSWLLFWASVHFEFTYIKRNNRQMGFTNVRNENAEQESQLRNWKFAYLCDLLLHNYSNNKMGPRVTFSGIKEKRFDSSALVFICLHSSSDSSTLIYTRLMTRCCL